MVLVSVIISVLAGLVAGLIVYLVLRGNAQPASIQANEEPETLLDSFGVICFRVANRVVISTVGGALLVLMLGKPKARRI